MRYLISNFSILIFTFSSFTVRSQAPDTLMAFNTFKKAMAFYRGKFINYDSAAKHFEKAAEEYKKLGNFNKVALCKLRSGNCAYNSRNYRLAISKLLKARDYVDGKVINPKTLSDIFNNLGSAYTRLGKDYLAKINMENSFKIRLEHLGPSHKGTGLSYGNLGAVYMNFGEYQMGLDYCLKALPIYLENYGEKSPRLGGLYVNIGILYDKKGDHIRAIDYYLKANDIDLHNYGEHYAYSAYNYHNLALSYRSLGKDSLAIVNFHKSINLTSQKDLTELRATSIYELGKVSQENGQLESALKNYKMAVDIITKNFDKVHPRLNYYYRAMASVKQEKKQYDAAEELLNKAIEIIRKNYGNFHTNAGTNFMRLANLYRVQERYDEALSAMDKGFQATLSGKRLDMPFELLPEQIPDLHGFLDLLNETAEILIDRYDYQSKSLEDLKSSLSHFHTASQIIDHIRRGYITESSKIYLQNRATSLYDKAIDLCIKLYSVDSKDHYLYEALAFSEKSKATVLAEALQAAGLINLQGIPDNVILAEKALKEQILVTKNNYMEVSQNNSEQNDIDILKDELFILTRSYDSLAQGISQHYPDYYDLKYNLDVVEGPDIKKWLDNKTAILSYFIGKKHIYVFTITSQGIKISPISKLDLDPETFSTFRRQISDEKHGYQNFANLSHQIYQHLIKNPLSATSNIQRLIIVPDGGLNYIPFEALLTKKVVDNNLLPNYLIERYVISYANSLTLLINHNRQTLPFQTNYIGFAPSYASATLPYGSTPRSESNPSQLQGALEEVTTASRGLKGETYVNRNATEYNFKNIVKQPAILHLAMHAAINDDDPMRSRLLFTKEGDSIDDGNLNAYEIYNLKISSQLVVLSACNTGYGEIKRGEGIMSLSRAFKYAGCPNIVMSLWQANDQSSNEIISEFFKNLKKEIPKDEALRNAKLTYLKNADPLQAHPANWATLVLLGDSQPLHFNSGKNRLFIGLLLIMLIVTAIIGLRKYFLKPGNY